LNLSPLLGLLLPDIWLGGTCKKHDRDVIRILPVYLDFITMCVEASLNFQGALGQTMEKATPGPLRNEFMVEAIEGGLQSMQLYRGTELEWRDII